MDSESSSVSSLQFCIWDQYQLLEEMDARRSVHLAQLTAAVVASFALSLSILKVGSVCFCISQQEIAVECGIFSGSFTPVAIVVCRQLISPILQE